MTCLKESEKKELERKKLAQQLHDELVGASFEDIYYEIYGVRLKGNANIYRYNRL